MKYIFTLSVIIALAMVSFEVTAQNGGMIVKDVNASEKIIVGSEAGHHTDVTDKCISLQPLTKPEIDALTPQAGMLAYDTDSDIIKFYNGTAWTSFIAPESVVPFENTFTDSRDNNTYNIVKIGDQWWMSENLKYLPSVVGPAPESETVPYYYVYDYNGTDVATAKLEAKYNTYGVLYNWPAAIDACPEGWHLPTDAEWDVLDSYIESDGHSGTEGTALKLEIGWNGTDDYGFAGLPGGSLSYEAFNGAGENGYWWSSNTIMWGTLILVLGQRLTSDGTSVLDIQYGKASGLSVRCLKN